MPNTKEYSKTKHAPGSIGELLVIALPMMASSACDTIMTFTDRVFLSKVSTAHMNAALAGGLTSFLMLTFFTGLIGYSTALVAQYLGAGVKRNCAVVVTQAGIVALVAYPIILMLSPVAISVFRASGIAPEQLNLQLIYFSIMIWASIVGLMRGVLGCFFSGIGRTRMVMMSSIVSIIVNITGNYILIFGKLGFPALGMRGAAYGTIAGGVAGLLVLAWGYFNSRISHEYDVKHSFRFDSDVMRKLLKFGYPAGLEFVLTFTAFTTLILLFQAEGQTVATAATVTFNWDMVAFVPLLGVEIAVTSLVGRYMGARDPDTAHKAAMSGLKVGSLYSGTMMLLFILFPVILINVFRPDANDALFIEALPLTIYMVRLMSVYVILNALMVAVSGALRGAGDTFWAMCAFVTLHWLMVGILFVLFKVLHLSAQIAWIVVICCFLMFGVVFVLRYRSGKWREIQVIQTLEGESERVPAAI